MRKKAKTAKAWKRQAYNKNWCSRLSQCSHLTVRCSFMSKGKGGQWQIQPGGRFVAQLCSKLCCAELSTQCSRPCKTVSEFGKIYQLWASGYSHLVLDETESSRKSWLILSYSYSYPTAVLAIFWNIFTWNMSSSIAVWLHNSENNCLMSIATVWHLISRPCRMQKAEERDLQTWQEIQVITPLGSLQ